MFNYDYNSSREELRLREYGRFIQCLVKRNITIEDRAERTDDAHKIVALMHNMNYSGNKSEEVLKIVWADLYTIAHHSLDIDCPYVVSEKVVLASPKTRLSYYQKHIKFRNYGNNVMLVIDEIPNLQEKDRELVIVQVARFMMKFSSWNGESADWDSVLSHISSMSNNKLKQDIDAIKSNPMYRIEGRKSKRISKISDKTVLNTNISLDNEIKVENDLSEGIFEKSYE